MRAVRQRLSCVIGVWLVCQFAGLAAAPLSFAAMPVAAETQKCTCPPGTAPGDACPMHHGHEGARECVLRNASTTTDALLSLFANVGLMPPVQTIVATVAAAEVMPSVSVFVVSHPVRPESPPPRA